MLISTQKTEIAETASKFFENPEADVEGWLRDAVTCWANEGKAAAFAPFQNYFPSDQPDAVSLAWVGTSFPAKKTVGDSLSLKGKFRNAVVSILGYPELYLSDLRAWRMVLEVAQEMAVSESAKTLTALVNDGRFHKAGNDNGHFLFLAAFNAVGHFGVTPDVAGYWKASLAHIDKYPSLSPQLLENLARAEPEKWSEYLTDTRMIHALTKFRDEQREQTSPWKIPDIFIWLQQDISKTISDRDYFEGAARVIRSNVEFLLDFERLKRLDFIRETQAAEPKRVPPTAPIKKIARRNLRAKAGQVNGRAQVAA
jgi:hypothetical protein